MILTLGFIFLVSSIGYPCTMILAGKKATSDGSVLLAHNNDLPGKVASMLQIVPGRNHEPGEMIDFKNGLRIPQAPETYRMLMMNCYYGFAEGDAKAVNRFQVAVAGGTSLKDDRNQRAREKDPLIKQGVSGYIRYIALQRSKTARECVQMIGRMYSTYGISYPSAVGVADANEVWYIEAGGGKCWAARRVPDDSYLIAANGYRIGAIDFDDKENFILPDYLKSYAIKKGLWEPGNNKPFHFAKIFGGNTNSDTHHPYYNARRVWRGQQLLSPSVKANPDEFYFPFALEPDKKITVSKLISVMRDYYRGTPFETYRSHPQGSDPKETERPIGSFTTVHVSVIQLRGNLPPEIGAVLWGGVGTALTTPYVPYYFGVRDIPTPFKTAPPEPDNHRSAFWRFMELAQLMEPQMPRLADQIVPEWEGFEKTLFQLQPVIEQTALDLYRQNKEQAIDFLNLYSSGIALQALDKAEELVRRWKPSVPKEDN